MHRLVLSLLGFVGGVFLAGCVQFSQSHDTSSLPVASHPEDVHLLLKSAPDPYEPINRVFFNLDKSLFTYALEPVWSGYNAVIPKKARTGIRHFGNNITYPVRLTGNLLQGEWANVGTETKRFLINTTVGVLGFSDPATEKYEINPANEDIGQALGKWGWTTSSYLHLPVWGASSPRDVIGGAGAIYLDPSSWFYGAGATIRFNDRSFEADSTRQLLDIEFDPYALNKLYYTHKRAMEIANIQPTMEGEDTPQTQTLLTVFNRPKDDQFLKKADTVSVQPKGFRKPLTASVWMQAKPSPIAFVIPGLGGHRLSTRALALAELAYLEGYQVVCFSNNLNWEFIQAAPADYLPGYLDDDLLYLRQIHNAINTKMGAQANGKPAVMGFSMGGWYTLNLAATSDPDAYSCALSINPPLDLYTGLRALDQLFRAPAGDKNQDSIKASALAKLLTIQVQGSNPKKGSDLPFSDQEASYLIGLSYRFTLTQTIMSSLEIARSSTAHEKVGVLSWEDYYSKILAPDLAKRNIDANAMSQASNLRTREAGLTAVKDLKLVLTGNDFLLTKEDLAWFRERFPGERTIFTETGGHMGQLWKKEVYDAMRAAIRQPAQ
jgi:phospholipid-binding lipoprotein MlaA